MAQEIERQYVVNTEHPDWQKVKTWLPMKKYIQATIHRGEGNKLRVRLIEDPKTGSKSAAFTFKVDVKSKKDGPNIREEYEWEVPYRVALYITIWHKEVIKYRYTYRHIDGKIWEFDEYQGENEGITLADIEIKDEDEKFDLPSWIGQETTKLKKITNNSFSDHPFLHWSTEEKEWYETLKKRK
jgi:adenylate cyclase